MKLLGYSLVLFSLITAPLCAAAAAPMETTFDELAAVLSKPSTAEEYATVDCRLEPIGIAEIVPNVFRGGVEIGTRQKQYALKCADDTFTPVRLCKLSDFFRADVVDELKGAADRAILAEARAQGLPRDYFVAYTQKFVVNHWANTFISPEKTGETVFLSPEQAAESIFILELPMVTPY